MIKKTPNFLSMCSDCKKHSNNYNWGGTNKLKEDDWYYNERTGELFCQECYKRMLELK